MRRPIVRPLVWAWRIASAWHDRITQRRCPVMGRPIDPKISVTHWGRRVYLCCPGCIDIFKRDPAKYITELDAEQ